MYTSNSNPSKHSKRDMAIPGQPFGNPFLKLAPFFNAERLYSEVKTIPDDAWVRHYVPRHYEGDWSVIPLYSVGGEASHIFAVDSDPTVFLPTPWLEQCTYMAEIIKKFPGEKTAIRLMRLGAGSQIFEHIDGGLGFEDEFVRIHIPILTNPQTRFFCGGEEAFMQPGECWYIDGNQKHSVINEGDSIRIHLVIDTYLNETLRDMFEEAGYTLNGSDSKHISYPTAVLEEMIYQLRTHNNPTSDAMADKYEKELERRQ